MVYTINKPNRATGTWTCRWASDPHPEDLVAALLEAGFELPNISHDAVDCEDVWTAAEEEGHAVYAAKGIHIAQYDDAEELLTDGFICATIFIRID